MVAPSSNDLDELLSAKLPFVFEIAGTALP